jgi:hypothetical protein
VVGLLRRMRVGFVVVGAAMALVGALGLAFGWGSKAVVASHGAPAVSPSSTVDSPGTSAAPSSRAVTTTTLTAENPSSFLAAYVAALRGGDRTFLFDRMHPVVIARYGATQCQAVTSLLVDPNASLALVSVSGPASFDYASDGRSTPVPDTYTFAVNGTVGGKAGPRQYHFALVEGRYRTFVDCGTPVPG